MATDQESYHAKRSPIDLSHSILGSLQRKIHVARCRGVRSAGATNALLRGGWEEKKAMFARSRFYVMVEVIEKLGPL